MCFFIRKPHTHTLWKRVGVRGRFPKVAVKYTGPDGKHQVRPSLTFKCAGDDEHTFL